MDVEIASMNALAIAQREATEHFDREHVTPFLYRSPERFKICQLVQQPDLAEIRWTVDTPADFDFVARIFAHFLPLNRDFLQKDILEFLQYVGPMPERVR